MKNAVTRHLVRRWPFYFALILIYLGTRNLKVLSIMGLGMAFFGAGWHMIRRQFEGYSMLLGQDGSWSSSKKAKGWFWTMVALTVTLVLPMSDVALRGTADSRMIWAFHEDEGWLVDLYGAYMTQPHFDLGDAWGYTYGSFHLMLITVLARLIQPFVHLEAAHLIIMNRLLLLGALVGTGWTLYYAGRRFLGSPLAGVLAAALLWSNSKVLEMAIPSNYPDIFGMFFLTLALLYIARLVVDTRPMVLFLAPLLIGLGFSVKYMGLPFLLILLLVFRLTQGKLQDIANPPSRTQLRIDLIAYAGYAGLALPVAFFMVNPFYLIHWQRFLSQMKLVMALYGSGNINNLPTEAIVLPSTADWWRVLGGAGTPDYLLFGAAIASFGLAWLIIARGRRPDKATSLVAVAGLATVLWVFFVTKNSNFAFFHYFLPMMPVVYLSAVALPVIGKRIFFPSIHFLSEKMGVILVIMLASAMIGMSIMELKGATSAVDAFQKSRLGYAARETVLQSRIGRDYQLWATMRRTKGSIAMEVGEWLAEHTPEARSLVTNETIFYYPPSIKEIRYWNRNLNLEALFRTMPDLLIVSDYFVDMYTKDYNAASVSAMPTEQREVFLKEREFYMLLQGQQQFLNYKEIKTFTAPETWYWKRLRIFKRQGPRVFGKLVSEVSGLTIMSSPNNRDILDREDFSFPTEVYLASFPENPIPSELTLKLKQPILMHGVGFVWYNENNHPVNAEIRGFYQGDLVFRRELPISSETTTPYSWVDVQGNVDQLVLAVAKFKGQQRLLLRRLLLGERELGKISTQGEDL